MGASTHKDSGVEIYMDVGEEFYVVGEKVEGRIYLHVKEERKYDRLVVKLVGCQYVNLGENNEIPTCTDSYHQNYDCQFLVHEFGETVPVGQYVFPFSFILPSAMSGSFEQNMDEYISYILKCILVNEINPKQCPVYQLSLNVQEVNRKPHEEILCNKFFYPSCCFCSYGSILLNFHCHQNFIRNGDQICINGAIDNTEGTGSINKTKVGLIQRKVFMGPNHLSTFHEDWIQIFREIGPVQPGQKEEFEIKCTVVEDMSTYTAIGRVLARYLILMMESSVGACGELISCEAHIVGQSTKPKIKKNVRISPPDNWNPQQFTKVEVMSMSPFVYKPFPTIKYTNQENMVSSIMKVRSKSSSQGYPENPGNEDKSVSNF